MRRGWCFLPAVVLSTFLISPLRAEDPVYFADPLLKAAVEAELWISDPTPSDMLGLTFLYAGSLGASDLTGLEYATNLQSLSLRWNTLTDLSVLSALVNLEHLDLHGNFRISDISPLSALTRLKTLVLRSNAVSDISALAGLTDLEELDLRDNEIGDISALGGLVHLHSLNLEDNQVRDVSPLTSLTSLGQLDLRINPLNSDACMTDLPQIIMNNPGLELEYDGCGTRSVEISSSAGGKVTYPGEGLFEYDNAEFIRLQAQADPCFMFVNWSGDYPSRDNPVFITVRDDYTIRANFVSMLSIIHVDDDGPGDPAPGDSSDSDPGENGTAEHPFDRIQEAIEVAGYRATVFVHAGTYHETIDLLGKRITVTGFHPWNMTAPSWPVLDGGGAGPVVSCSHGEDANTVLSGFVITGGRDKSAGAILCSGAGPTIANCLIVGNRATDATGAAVSCTNSQATLVNCTIADNYAGADGAALYLHGGDVVVVNSILWDNTPEQVLSDAGGLASIQYSAVAGGWAGVGCIDADPFFVGAGYWADPNDPDTAVTPENAQAIWVMGGYHLQSRTGRWNDEAAAWVQDQAGSPCIDAGDPDSPVGQEPAPNGAVINMGTYGGTAHASKSGLP